MNSTRIEIDLPPELMEELRQVADALQLGPIEEAAIVAIANWVAQRKAELDDRDPDQRYFINEALDDLAKKK